MAVPTNIGDNPAQVTFNFQQDNNYRITLTMTDSAGDAVDISGLDFRLYFSDRPDPDKLIQETYVSAVKQDSENGIFYFDLDEDKIAELKKPRNCSVSKDMKYRYGYAILRMKTNISGIKNTVATGPVYITYCDDDWE